MRVNVPRIMIAAAASGGGKTTAACAVMRALKDRGHKTAPFKCGPDYIDPMYHRAASGQDSVNLDLFFQGQEMLKSVFAANASDADIAVIEGVMGFYDGSSMAGADGSSYEISRCIKAPVILVLEARGMAYTVIPVIKGLTRTFGDSNIRGLILNGVTKMTYMQLKPVIERETGIAAVGYMPRMSETLKSRHLGLVTPMDTEIESTIAAAAELAAQTLDLERIIKIAADAEAIEAPELKTEKITNARVAIASDPAFCFYYKDNLDLIRDMGAELMPFSPLYDRALPECDGIIFGGGYPELYAKALSENKELLRDIKTKISGGLKCLAECGGFMYLGKSVGSHEMVGAIDSDAHRTERLVRFGYVNITGNNRLLKPGEVIKAHEFHYWDSSDNGTDCMAVKPNGKRSWQCIHAGRNIFAGYPHLYYRSNEEFIKRWLRL